MPSLDHGVARPPRSFWQVGVLVQDLEAAMDELSRALGLTWSDVKRFGSEQARQRVVMSREGPPYFELVEGPPNSPWDSSAGSRLDHLAYWVDDIQEERERLEREGAPVVMDGQARGKLVNYHALPAAGFRVEVFDESRREELRRDWDMDDLG